MVTGLFPWLMNPLPRLEVTGSTTYSWYGLTAIDDVTFIDCDIGPEAPVKITRAPSDANVPPYVDVKFNCTATGNPPPTIEWRYNGRSLPDDKRWVAV